jgi:hypothetical protein
LWAQTACAAALLLNILSILRPTLAADDWQILVESWTWDRARANLWLPHNEHSMPLGRLAIWLMGHLAVNQGNVPLVFALQGPLALLAAMLLVYLLVRRETGQPFLALLALALFGVNTHYQSAVVWFSASYTVVALDMLLLGLLAAQRWRQTGRRRYLALSALWCALAPGWFGSGVLAGPLCALYLLAPPSPDQAGPPHVSGGPRKVPTLSARLWEAARRVLLPAVVPLLGTALSLAITLPLNGKKIMDLRRVELDASAWETFNPLVGLEYTLRTMVDDLIPGAIGFPKVTSPIPVVIAVWAVLLAAGVWWWRQAPHRALLVLGLGMIFASYEAIYTVRAYFSYEDVHDWGRYHLVPHLGLVLIVCGGLPRRVVAWVNAASPRAIDLGAACLLGLLLLTQCPRAGALYYGAQQAADLERVAAVDARCREHHIDAATARQVLPAFEITGMSGVIDGRPLSAWDLLRGSDDPRPMTVEEARRLLEGE